jgi:hypothetical protein
MTKGLLLYLLEIFEAYSTNSWTFLIESKGGMTVFQEQGRGALEHLLPRLPRNGKKATCI